MPISSANKRWIILIALALAALTIAVYIPAFALQFTGYDDNDYVTDNPYVQRGISVESIRWAFTTGHAANWHPVTWLSHALDWQLGQQRPLVHHAANVMIHAANAALLFVLLWRCTGALWPSAIVAALFAVHPLNVQSVAWVAERKNVLSTLFGLLSLIAYQRYAKSQRKAAYVATAAWLALGLMSKPMLVTWPFVMLLLDYWPLGRIKSSIVPIRVSMREARPLVFEKLPLFALVILSSVVTYLVQSKTAMAKEFGVPLYLRLENAILAYGLYLWKMIWPFGLAAFYPHPLMNISHTAVIVSFLVIVLISIAVLRSSATRRYLPVGWFFYLGTLVPVIGLVQVGSQAMADRYAYVPLIGTFIMLAWGGADLVARLPKLRVPMISVVAMAILMFAARTWNEIPNWHDGQTLWKHALQNTSGNNVAHNNLASSYIRYSDQLRAQLNQGAGDPVALRHRIVELQRGAVEECQKALEIAPNHSGALVNLGLIMLDQNRNEEAVDFLERAVHVNPAAANAYLNLGMAYLRLNQVEKAQDRVTRAQALAPHDPKVYNSLGVVAIARRRPDEATRYFEQALAISPSYRSARSNLERLRGQSSQ